MSEDKKEYEVLDEFFDYKNRFMEDILTDEDIVHLINENIKVKDSKKLVYTQVFPFEYIPDTVEEGKTFICCDVDIDKSLNKTFLSPVMYVWIFTHKSKLPLPTGGVRTDKLCSKIATKMAGSRFYGLGELELYSVRRFAPMTDFQGKVMTFYAKDFNRPFVPDKQTPSNRKRG